MKQLIVINSTGRHRKAPSEFNGTKSLKQVSNQRQLINSISIQKLRGKEDYQFNAANAIGVNSVNDHTSEEQFFSSENGPVLFEPFQQKNYHEEDSMIAYDSNPLSGVNRANMKKDLFAINQEISPKQAPKLGIHHRRNKTATENSNILTGYLSN